MTIRLLYDLLNYNAENLLAGIIWSRTKNELTCLFALEKGDFECLYIDKVVGPVQARLSTHFSKSAYSAKE